MVSGERLPFLCSPWGVLSSLLFLHGVGTLASQLINKTEGENVQFDFNNFRGEDQYDVVRWIFNGSKIAEKYNASKPEYLSSSFEGRLEMNNINFSLTVKKLELRDSGIFGVVTDLYQERQPDTQFITLHVYKSITEVNINSNFSWLENGSCAVNVGCSSPGHPDVSYRLVIKNQTHHQSWVLLHLHPAEQVAVTCTAQNPVSNKTESGSVSCSATDSTGHLDVIISSSVCGVLLFLIVALVCYRCRKTESDPDMTENTVYADITNNIERPSSNTINPTCIYDMVQDHVVIPADKPAPLSVYDTIQFNRTPPVPSQYQHML